MKLTFKIETRPIEKFMIGALILIAVIVAVFTGTTDTTIWTWAIGAAIVTFIGTVFMMYGIAQEDREEHIKREHNR